MSDHRFAIIDPSAGIAGDMLLGALVDAGAPETWLRALPARLGLEGVSVDVGRTIRCGISCARVKVILAQGQVEHPNPEFGAETPVVSATHYGPSHQPHDHHGHTHGGEFGAHRHLGDLLAIVEAAPLSPWVRDRSADALRLLCAEEGRVHGVPTEAVALHEVGALDAIVDIVGCIEGFEQLGVTRIATMPLGLGSGWVRTAHGVMPLPAPVTARLVEGLAIGPNGPVTGEATTPTGAALLRVLVNQPVPPRWRAGAVGWGAGSRDPSTHPNALRLLLAESSIEAGQVVVLSTDVDDMNPEYMEPLREALAEAAALDVQIWSTFMKKGRPGFRIEVICATDSVERVTEALFLHSTTTGVRRMAMERITLPRKYLQVTTGSGEPVSVKVVETPGGPRLKAEFRDVLRVAGRSGRPALEIAREVESAARSMVVPPVRDPTRSS
ncbi:MAG: nickel pincer cofactor biosynthesis protein LarC [Gemmatimonadota bacterium]|nr:nickel pincer cofactor biosynthesis protein LarC [Gemmatimonadota bacterium]